MLRLTHVSGGQLGKELTLPGPQVRVGRGSACDLRYEAEHGSRVSHHHADLVLEGGRWFVVDTESEHGVLVNGAKVQRQVLNPGDQISFGVGGPTVRVERVDAIQTGAEPRRDLSALREQAYSGFSTTAESPLPQQVPVDGGTKRERSAASVAQEVAQEVARQRALSGGQSSGQTVFIMASAIETVHQEARRNARGRWVKIVSGVVGAAVVLTAGLGVVIFRQRQQIQTLVNEKNSLDEQIVAVQRQMNVETDESKLAELEVLLQSLTGRAKSKRDELGQLGRSNARAVDALAKEESGDELDGEIRSVLRKFGAETYAVPPVFKDRLRAHIDELVSGNLTQTRARWRHYWPMIQRAFSSREMPEELGYIAYVESRFDPTAYNDKAGARGMWQLIPTTARTYGLKVDATLDERVDPEKGAQAAAKYLSSLLIEFGEQSFMLVLASYNKGEDGVRRALHKVAREPGGFRKRDFWHLYRVKLLPEETREYVPAVIAAAIVFENPMHYGDPTVSAPPSRKGSLEKPR